MGSEVKALLVAATSSATKSTTSGGEGSPTVVTGLGREIERWPEIIYWFEASREAKPLGNNKRRLLYCLLVIIFYVFFL